MSELICDVCGAEKESYPLIDRETGNIVGNETVCPNLWRHD